MTALLWLRLARPSLINLGMGQNQNGVVVLCIPCSYILLWQFFVRKLASVKRILYFTCPNDDAMTTRRGLGHNGPLLSLPYSS